MNKKSLIRICTSSTSVTTLSPFVIAETLAPTTVSFPVSGRVSDANGRGISKAYVKNYKALILRLNLDCKSLAPSV